MSKKKKEHRKRVNARNNRIKSEKARLINARRNLLDIINKEVSANKLNINENSISNITSDIDLGERGPII